MFGSVESLTMFSDQQRLRSFLPMPRALNFTQDIVFVDVLLGIKLIIHVFFANPAKKHM